MAVQCRWILVLTLLLAGGQRLWAASPAERAFDAAVKAFRDTFYSRAEAQLADFCQKNPTSPRLPEAILVQAQARLELTNYAGAIELLIANQAKAGTNADQYLFWLGEAYARKGDWRAASDTFAKLVKEQPTSPRCLEASVGEASARSALARTEPAEWQRVIGLLQETNGLFQSAARTNAAGELVPRGYLLLSEAQLAAKDYRAAEATLQPLTNRLMSPRLGWQLQYLLCRIQLADGRTNAALQGATNLLAMAAKDAQPSLLAESAAFQASLFEHLGQPNDAVVAYQKNLAENIPADRQRQALLKITELSLAQTNIPQAAQMLETFLARYPEAASADLAWLTLGELRLRQCEAGVGVIQTAPATTNAPAATNDVLQLALGSFNTLVKKFPQSPYLGKAQLDLGWCYAREGDQAAFQTAVSGLPMSKELATNYFRLAETQFQQTNYAGAIKSYQAIIEKFGALPEVQTNLFEPALYQMVRAGLAGGDLAAATNATQNLRALYPKTLSAASAVLLTAQDMNRQGNPVAAAAARKILLDFDQAVPDAPLKPERQLAVAATWEQEKNWAEAVTQYDGWLASFTNHLDGPQAEYHRAWDTFYAGRTTNALTLFSEFIIKYPTNEFARLARLWVADYYYNLGAHAQAELNYQLLVRDTNCAPDLLTYGAQLMAGLAAAGRQGWSDAKIDFLSLYNNTNGPSGDEKVHQRFEDLRLQALFAYGQTLMSHLEPTDTNRLANCEEATRVFGRVYDKNPTNQLAVQALLEKAKCYKEWALARLQYDSLTNALNAYEQVVHSAQADVAARSEAKVGQAIVLEKWAQQKTGKERTALLEQALNHCLDVVYGRPEVLHGDEKLHELWTKEAGLKGLDLADALQAWSQEVGLYGQLTNSVWPQLPASVVKRAKEAQEKLDREKASR
jgi:TolA-binding protein